jgi:hypothetical protein
VCVLGRVMCRVPPLWCVICGVGWGVWESLLSTKPTRRPVRPPTRPSAPDTPLAALAIAGPAVEATRDRPSVALEAAEAAEEAALEAAPEAVPAVCEAVCLAASAAFCVVLLAVDDSKRAMVRPTVRPDRLMTRAKDILCVCVGFCSFLGSGFLGEGKGRLDSAVGRRCKFRRSERRMEDWAQPKSNSRMAAVGGSWVRRKERYRARWTGDGMSRRSRKIGQLKIRKALAACQVSRQEGGQSEGLIGSCGPLTQA